MKKFSQISEALNVLAIDNAFTEKITELLDPVNPKDVKATFVQEQYSHNEDDFNHGLNIFVSMPEEPLDQCIEEIQAVKKIMQDNFKIKKDTIKSHKYIKSGGGAYYYDIYFLISEEDMSEHDIVKSVIGINKFDL